MTKVFRGALEPLADRRKFLLGLLFCSAAAVAAWRQPHIRIDLLGKQKLDDLIPKAIGRWSFVTASGLVIPPEDDFEKSLYSNVLTRVYSDGLSTPIMLLIAQNGSQTGFLQVHRPEFCYTAGGYRISPIERHNIRVGSFVLPASRMDATAGGPTEHVVYWTRIGNTIPTSWARQKVVVAEQNLEGIIPDAILIRVSTVNDNATEALASIDAFIRKMLESVPAAQRSVFIV